MAAQASDVAAQVQLGNRAADVLATAWEAQREAHRAMMAAERAGTASLPEMMEAHGTAPVEFRYNYELMKSLEKNPECTGQGSKAQALGMQIAVAKAVVAGRTLVVKEQGSVASARAAMREMGAHAVMAYRSNVLARMLCEAKDCFESGVNGKITIKYWGGYSRSYRKI